MLVLWLVLRLEAESGTSLCVSLGPLAWKGCAQPRSAKDESALARKPTLPRAAVMSPDTENGEPCSQTCMISMGLPRLWALCASSPHRGLPSTCCATRKFRRYVS